MKEKDLFFGLGLAMVAIAILWIVLTPFVIIWSLNTLFSIGIGYGFFEWLAIVLLWLVSTARVAFSKA